MDDPLTLGGHRPRPIAELGAGALGRTWLAHGADGTLVAVKEIRPELVGQPGFRARLRRELETARRIDGPHTAALLDADTEAREPWLARAFVPGVPLSEALAVFGALPERAVQRLARDLALSLQEIHRVGAVHGSLHPGNIVLGADGAHATDAVLARIAEPAESAAYLGTAGGRLTHGGWLAGAPAFLAPEQAEGRRLTPRSDLFALGAVLAAACTSRSPFARSSTVQTLHAVLHADPDLDAVPEALRGLVESCLRRDPLRRPSPAQLLSLLAEAEPQRGRRLRPEPSPAPEATVWHGAVATLIERRSAEATPAPTAGASGRSAPVVGVRGRRRIRARLRIGTLAALAAILAGALVWTVRPHPATSAPPHPHSSPAATPPTRYQPITLLNHTGYISGVAFAPNGNLLASAGNDATVRLWDLTRSQHPSRVLDAPAPVTGLAFSPDGRLLATGLQDGTALLWRVADGRRDGPVLDLRAQTVDSVAFSPDGRLLAVGGDNGTVRLWQVADRHQDGAQLLRYPFTSVAALAFSPDSRTLATGDNTGNTRLWDVASLRQTGQALGGSLNVGGLAFSPDGRTLAAAGWDHSVRLWDPASHQLLARLGDPATVVAVAYSPDGSRLVTADDDQLRLWDASDHRLIGTVRSGTVPGPDCVGFSPDGRRVATGDGDRDGAVQIWDVRDFR
ncbi:serine/threonine-protein kinase [Streptomyces monashensis]|uniref:WD40 repeat domain-containing serine/threonine protein kinase n=1 Tax=Streptomyces monashensis TaxID=1678012 RepID=UPI0033D25176